MYDTFLGLYVVPACLTYLGIHYRYAFVPYYKRYSFDQKDWILILTPIVNLYMTFALVAQIIFDIAFKISDFFEKK